MGGKGQDTRYLLVLKAHTPVLKGHTPVLKAHTQVLKAYTPLNSMCSCVLKYNEISPLIKLNMTLCQLIVEEKYQTPTYKKQY